MSKLPQGNNSFCGQKEQSHNHAEYWGQMGKIFMKPDEKTSYFPIAMFGVVLYKYIVSVWKKQIQECHAKSGKIADLQAHNNAPRCL